MYASATIVNENLRFHGAYSVLNGCMLQTVRSLQLGVMEKLILIPFEKCCQNDGISFFGQLVDSGGD